MIFILFSACAENSAKLFYGEMQNPRGQPADLQQEKEERKNEKDEELFVYIVPPNCE